MLFKYVLDHIYVPTNLHMTFYNNNQDSELKSHFFSQIRTRRKSPETTFAVIKNLLQRNRLRSALAGRDDAAVADIFKFLTKQVSDNFKRQL